MRRMWGLLAVFLLAGTVPAAADVLIDAANFPDGTFRDYVREFDSGGDGALSDGEIAGVTGIYVASRDIGSLEGIEHFTALVSLDCSFNRLTELDVSRNTALTVLDCSFNRLTALDVSRNTALTVLDCNNNQLTELDVSNNTELWDLRCHKNRLTALDVSQNTALEVLSCGMNRLAELDVSRNTALVWLYCPYNRLTELDVRVNVALSQLHFGMNRLAEVDVSRNTALIGLGCNNNQLTELDVRANTALRELYCYKNQLTALDVSQNTALEVLSCGMSRLAELDVRANTVLRELYCNNNRLTALDVSRNAALTDLYCSDNRLTALDVSKNTALIWLNCASNHLTFLDLHGLDELINPASIDVGWQMRGGLTVLQRGSEYNVDLGAFVSPDRFAKVSRVAGEAADGTPLTLLSFTGGIATFTARPEMVTYWYATGKEAYPMEVTLVGVMESPADIPVSTDPWTIRWGERDARGNSSVTVDVRIESESPLIANSLSLDVSGIGVVRIELLPNEQVVSSSGVPARAAAQKHACTLRVTGTVAESARDTARIKAVYYKLEGSNKERRARLVGTDGGGILLKDMTEAPEAPETDSGGGGCDAALGSVVLLALVPLARRRR